mgnify:CR=1 FL=1
MQHESWYKNPWVWLIIALPLSSVIAGIATMIITSNNQPYMVVDDYYKKGKAINQELTLYNEADKLGIELQLKVTSERIEIKSNQPLSALKVSMVHSTLEDRDFDIVLTPNALGTLSSSIENEMSGKWQIIVAPMDNNWKKKSTIGLPYSDWIAL